jgi:hypothetical protein
MWPVPHGTGSPNAVEQPSLPSEHVEIPPETQAVCPREQVLEQGEPTSVPPSRRTEASTVASFEAEASAMACADASQPLSTAELSVGPASGAKDAMASRVVPSKAGTNDPSRAAATSFVVASAVGATSFVAPSVVTTPSLVEASLFGATDEPSVAGAASLAAASGAENEASDGRADAPSLVGANGSGVRTSVLHPASANAAVHNRKVRMPLERTVRTLAIVWS